MSGNLAEQLRLLPTYLGWHLLISLLALGLGIAISLPVAILVTRRQWLRWPTLTVASVVQTIPSLALLALMVPVLVFIGVWTPLDVPALGFYPAIIALTLYSMLPILRNTVTGIQGIDPALQEAARGLGMTARQRLWRVELPLAAPVIIAGIRTATVWVIGIATLATPVGQTSLGNYIFSGLQTQNWTAVLVGCVAAAVLAILLDLLIALLQAAAARRSKRMGAVAGVGLAVVIAAGLGPMAAARLRPVPAGGTVRPVVVVGSKPFTEQYILAELIEQTLEEAGFTVRKKESLGSTVAFHGVAIGEIDCYVDYTGTIWTLYMEREEIPGSEQVLAESARWLEVEHDIQSLGPLGFENAYVFAMHRPRAENMGIRTIGDLAPRAPSLTIGADPEFFNRPDWFRVRDAYGLNFGKQTTLDSTFMYQAVAHGQVDVIGAYSSDGRIAAHDLVTLEDPREGFPPYDAVLLASSRAVTLPGFAEALKPLIGAIDVEIMRRANQMVDEEGASVEQAAAWLRSELGLTE